MGNLLGSWTFVGMPSCLRPNSTASEYPSREQGHYVDGLRAPFVIHPEEEVHSYDAEYTIIMSDWYHDEHSVLLKQFLSLANPGGDEPIPGQPN